MDGKFSFFLGRFQPLHDGHLALFDVVRKEGKKILIGIKGNTIDEKNPYTIEERIEMIKQKVPDAEYIIMPDIDEVVYGRKVGYKIRKLKLNNKIESISATKIRKKLNNISQLT